MVAGLLLTLALALLASGWAEEASATKGRKKKGKPVPFSIVSTPPLRVEGANQLNNKLYAPCPAGSFPYGGAVSATPPPGSDGQGVFPLGFERRGAQKDVHYVLMMYGPGGTAAPRDANGQMICGPKPRGLVPVQNIVQVDPGQTKTVVSTCPPGRFLIGGNFARTYFTSGGGDFVTQAEAEIAENSFVVTATAFGSFGGPVVDTAFCANTRTYTGTVSAPVTIPPHSTGTVTSPPCPVGNRIVWGGFDSGPDGAVFLGNTTFNFDQSYSASGYNRSSAPATFQDYGYCLAKNAFRHVHKK